MSNEIETMLIIDAQTNQSIERALNDDELAQRETDAAEAQSWFVEQQAKAAARESALAKLADLGLTAEEIAAL
jgi:hypothetical protein